MNTEFFISRRMASTASDGQSRVMNRIAAAAVALSLTVVIVAVAVIVGFKRDITSAVTGLSGNVVLTDLRSVGAMESFPLAGGSAVRRMIGRIEGVRSVEPYVSRGGVLRSDEGSQGVVLKGVDTTYDMAFWRQCLVEGELPDARHRKSIVISRSVADKLGLRVGDRAEMLFMDSENGAFRDRVRVGGIFSSGMEEIDGATALASIGDVRRINGWADSLVSGLEVRLERFDDTPTTAALLDTMLADTELPDTENWTAIGVDRLYGSLFEWLATHDVNAAVIIAIMLTVALFNMATALLILVLERTRMIGILRSIGMSGAQISRVFVWRAADIVFTGVVSGNVIALALCAVQYIWSPVRLDASGYLLSAVPVSVGWWLVWVDVAAVAAIVAVMLLPARIAARVSPTEALRYN